MTDEEIRKLATNTVEWESTPMMDRPLFVFAYMRGFKDCEESKWHYPGKGELPERGYNGETPLLLAIKKEPCNCSVIAETELSFGFYNGKFRTTGFIINILKNSDVIAWQYIEPPKEVENAGA